MALETLEWLRRVKAVAGEHTAARLAADHLVTVAARDPTALRKGVTLRDLRVMAARLEGTYVVRLFAEFETGLRRFWPTARPTEPPSRTAHLVDGLAATCRVPNDVREDVHAVREYRNGLVHERDEEVEPVPISECRGHLCRFFSYLPQDW